MRPNPAFLAVILVTASLALSDATAVGARSETPPAQGPETTCSAVTLACASGPQSPVGVRTEPAAPETSPQAAAPTDTPSPTSAPFRGATQPAEPPSPDASPAAAAAPGASAAPPTAPEAPPAAPPAPGGPGQTPSSPDPSPSPTPSPSDGIIRTDGHGHLTLDGRPYQFVGVNAYELATLWSVNYGCGGEVDDLNGFFASLTPNSVVRFWAYQDFTQSKVTGGRDWSPLDRVVRSAEAAHQRLILTLADQWNNCNGEQFKDAGFFNGGYRTVVAPNQRESYWSWVGDVVARYRSSPAVGMWEPLNEPQGDCGAVKAPQLRAFFDSVGGLIKSIDPNHLVESGVLGGNQCGLTLGDYTLAQDTPNLDVLSYHDYGDGAAVPAALAMRLQQAQALSKPLIVGEVGFLSNCSSMQARQPAQFAAGVAGFLPWDWEAGNATCGF